MQIDGKKNTNTFLQEEKKKWMSGDATAAATAATLLNYYLHKNP